MLPTAFVIERRYRTSNIQRFDKNRKRLQALIFSKRTFTAEELFNEFSKGGDTVIDTEQNLDDYLKQMVNAGVLRFEFNRFTVR